MRVSWISFSDFLVGVTSKAGDALEHKDWTGSQLWLTSVCGFSVIPVIEVLRAWKRKQLDCFATKGDESQVFNPSCRFSSSEVLVDLLILIMCVIAWAEVWKRLRVITITGIKAWFRFLQEILVKPGAEQANRIICWLRQPQVWLHFSHQVVWKLSAFPLKYNSGIWAKPRWYLTPPCHVTYWGHPRHGVSV